MQELVDTSGTRFGVTAISNGIVDYFMPGGCIETLFGFSVDLLAKLPCRLVACTTELVDTFGSHCWICHGLLGWRLVCCWPQTDCQFDNVDLLLEIIMYFKIFYPSGRDFFVYHY